ncbi:rasGTPase-activating protein [Naegleria gruberi]|uniref:RasGTPase-activating protein n=1 Tax=Naegleria gruberi TaxID=5762 RepID=D2VWJ2_NAEGR|nr:rasGTPase-activating protein [Naegleria gruberi]EFC38849.1 rasGTPase-activating protein [Naegleria gruberi]|eukprot:XP_002671593.1 rasGTPase-activating protein [Naegleria gruberi strain NEG-M]
MEHLLVLTTVERIGDSLPSTPSSQRRKGFNLKGYIKTLNELIVLPNIDLHKVVQPLVDLYDNVSKTTINATLKPSEKRTKLELINKSKLIILNLLSDYINFAIENKELVLPNHHLNNLFCQFDNDDLLLEERRQEQDEEEDEDLVALVKEQSKNAHQPSQSASTITESTNEGNESPSIKNGSLNQISDFEYGHERGRSPSGLGASLDYLNAYKQRKQKKSSSKSQRNFNVKRSAATFTQPKELDEATALNIIQLVSTRLLLQHDMFYDATQEEIQKTAVNNYLEQQISYRCMEILFKISVCKPDTVFKTIVGDSLPTSLNNNCMDISFNTDLQSDKLPFSSSLSHFKLIEYVNWTVGNLEKLLKAVNENMKGFTKYLEVLTPPLRLAIWNFITNYNNEFVDIIKNPNASIVNTARETFDNIYKQTGKKQKNKTWPALATLCVLTADDLLKCVKAGNGKKFGGSENMTTFIHKDLLKAMEDKDKSLILPPLIDIYRAVSYAPSDVETAFAVLSLLVEEKFLSIFVPEPTTGKVSKCYSPEELNELEMWTFYVTTLYRRSPEKCKKQLMIPIMADGTLEQKQTVAKVLLFLLTDRSSQFTYNRKLEVDFKVLASSLREFFISTTDQFKGKARETGDDNTPTLAPSASFRTPKKGFAALLREKVGGKDSSNSPTGLGSFAGQPNFKMFDTVNTILHVFCADPRFFLTKSNESDQNINNFAYLADFFVLNSDPIVQDQITRLFQKLFLEQYIKNWGDDLFVGFSTISTRVLSRLSPALFLLNELEQLQATKTLLFLLRNITYCAKKFYIANRDTYLLLEHIRTNPDRINTLEVLCSNLLVCLCSTDKEIWQSTTRCLRDVCDQIEILNNHNIKKLNYNFYRQLASIDLNGKFYNERKSQIQLFKRVETQTPSILKAFGEVYNRWKELLDQLKSEDSASNITLRDLFPNYTSLLCALGGVCIQDTKDEDSSFVLDFLKPEATSANNVDSYMDDLMKQVISDDVNVRQMVTISVSTDLSPSLFTKLFTAMKASVQEQFGQTFVISQKNNLLVDQYLHILKTIVENPDTNTDLSLAQEIDSITDLFANYCTHSEFDNKDVLELKKKLCQFLEVLMSKVEYLTFKNIEEQKLRRTIIGHVMEWTTDSVFKEKTSTGASVSTPRVASEAPLLENNSQVSTEVKKLYTDLDLLCMKACTSLINGMVIANDEKGREEYSKYFAFLLRFLEKAKDSTFTATIYKAFSRLLQTNVSFGLEYYMSKVYDNNNTIRSTFLGLLSELIKKGLLVEEEEKNKQDRVSISEYQEIINKLVFTNRKRALFALFDKCKNPEKDDLCEAVIRVYQSKGEIDKNLLDLFRQSVTREVATTPKSQPETLFRANSTSTKLLKKYCLRVSNPYLTTVIGGFIDTMCTKPTKFEIDPLKAQQRGESVEENVENILEVLQEFIDCLCDSVQQTPYTFRMYCRYLYEEVGKKFTKPDDDNDEQFDFKYIAVGGFLILRLICPAITSPHLYGLSGSDIPADSRRYAIILTKLVQNLANGIVDSKKEEFMKNFVDIIRLNLNKIQTYFEKIAAPIVENEEVLRIEETVTEDELKEAYEVLYRFFYNYADTLREELSSLYDDIEDEEKEVLEEVDINEKPSSKQNGKSLNDLLEKAIEQFGKPAEEEKTGRRLSVKLSKDDEFSNPLLKELLRKNEKKDTSKIAEMKFFSISEHKNAKNQRIVYFIPYNLDLTRFSLDLYLYYVLKSMETIWKEPYIIVVDSTFLTKKFDIRLSVFIQLSKHIPQGAKKNLQEIYLVNPNTFFNKTTKKLVSMLSHNRWKVITTSSLPAVTDQKSKTPTSKDPLELVKPEHSMLPSLTQQLYEKSEIIYNTEVVLASHTTDCEIRLFDQYMFIVIKGEKFINNKVPADCLEHVNVTKIANIAVKKSLFGKSSKATKDFVVKYIDDEDAEAAYNFRAQTIEERDQIMQGIRNYVERKSRGTKTGKSLEREFKRLKLQDVPGQLLAISFFNLDSKHTPIRASAYSLLASIFEQVKISSHGLILESDAAYVPRNTENTVLRISEYVARNKPELTLEFICEALNAFKTIQGNKSKLKFASFILPWLDNLSRFEISTSVDEVDEKTETIKNWFENFTKLCIANEEIYPKLQNVWKHVCKLSLPLIRIAIESVIKQGTTSEMLMNGEQSIIGDILGTILLHSPLQWNVAQFIINKIVEPLMTEELNIDLLNKATVKELVKSKDILGKIPVYMSYLLMLSFNSQINLLENLPYVLFIISLFLGVGSDTYLRSIVYGICCNCVHSLVLELPACEQFEHVRAKLQKLHLRVLEKDIKSSFMGGEHEPQPFASYSDFVNKVSQGKVTFDETTMYKYEDIMRYFKEIIECFDFSYDSLIQARGKTLKSQFGSTIITSSKATHSVIEESSENSKDMDEDGTENDMTEGEVDDEHNGSNPSTSTSDIVKSGSDTIKSVWLKIFTNLCKDTMKTANLLLFPKSLISFSIISTSEQSYDMIPFVLNFIGKRGVETLSENELMLSVLLSINQFCINMVVEKDRIETLRKIIIFGFFLLTIANTKIYSAVTKLLSTVFAILFEARDIHDGFLSIGDYFNQVFRSDYSKYLSITKEFEETVGLSFGQHFSFTVSLLLMKGLAIDDSTIRKATISLLKQILSISYKLKFEPQNQLGFIAALIPFDKQYNSVLYSEQLYSESMFTKETVFLFQKYLFSITASNIDLDSCASVYRSLARGFEAIPDTFADVFQDHHSMSQVIKVYTSSQDDTIIEHSLNLFKIMSNNAKSKKLQVKEPFADYGFKGFRDQTTFQTTKDDLKKKCQKTLITFLTENFNEQEYPSMDSVIISKTGMKKSFLKAASSSPVVRQASGTNFKK